MSDDDTKPEKMTEDELLRILLNQEHDASSFYDSDLAESQAEAMRRYHAEPYGDELPDRSKVVTHDIEDTIAWIMPDLMRAFSPSDELITVDDPGLQDGDPALEEAGHLLAHAIFKDNDGVGVLHDFAFDGLLQKVGIISSSWCDPKPGRVREYESISPEQAQMIVNDPEYEVLEYDLEEETGALSLKVRHTPKVGRPKLQAIPPEEFRISRRAKSIEEADYHGWKRLTFLAEIIRDFPEHKDKFALSSAADDHDLSNDTRALARHPEEPFIGNDDGTSDRHSAKKVWEAIEYVKVDYDGDGTVELRRIRRCGRTILENDEVDESEFTLWTPIRVSHRAIGRSMADTILEITKIRTALTRAALDSLSRSLMPRTVVNRQRTNGTDAIDRLLDHDLGDVIEIDGDVRDAVMPLVTPDVSPIALKAIEYFDRQREVASGVSAHAQGIAPKAITQTAKGIEDLQSAANERIELVARWLSFGLQDAFEKLLRLIVRHQDGPRQIKVAGKQLQIDPRRWSEEMTVTVHVGMAIESRDKRMALLSLIAAKQEQILLNAGPGNPVVGFAEYRNTLSEMVRVMGFNNASRFFKEVPPESDQPPQPQPDPKLIEVQGKLQLEQQRAQATLQMDQQKAAATLQIEQQKSAAKMQSEEQLALLRLEVEERLALRRMEQEERLAVMKMNMEAQLRREMPDKPDTGGAGYQPGGRLDA